MLCFDKVCELATFAFDPIHDGWERKSTQKAVGRIQIMVFLLGMLGIELNRLGLLPAPLAAIAPTRHYYAINLAFTLVLMVEVLSLIFILPCSFSKSMGKQLEILALIMLRHSFKELSYFPEPIALTDSTMMPVYYILSDGIGALVIFLILGFYYKIQRGKKASKERIEGIYRFVAIKKLISLVLLLSFLGSAFYDFWLKLSGGHPYEFFESFYTLLIFTDVLIILLAQQLMPSFHMIFRNSGYALATLLMRLALTAPHFYNTALGVIAALFAISMTIAFNFLAPAFESRTSNKH